MKGDMLSISSKKMVPTFSNFQFADSATSRRTGKGTFAVAETNLRRSAHHGLPRN